MHYRQMILSSTIFLGLTISNGAHGTCYYDKTPYADKDRLCIGGKVHECRKDSWVNIGFVCGHEGERFTSETSMPDSPMSVDEKALKNNAATQQSGKPGGMRATDNQPELNRDGPAWICRVVWDFGWSHRKFEGTGPSEPAAFSAAVQQCKWNSFGMPDAWRCGTKPVSRKCEAL
jgi:hypothetical protein